MRILYNNAIKTSSLVRSSERASYPVENLFDPHLTSWFKTQTASAEWVLIPGTITASYFSILNHNFTSSAVIKIQGNDSNDWATPTLDLTIPITDYIMLESFAEATFNFWRISLDDPTNPDGCVRMGGAFLGTYIQMPGMRIDQQIDDLTTTDISYSTGRQIYADLGIDYKEFTINFPFITTLQRDDLRAMWKEVGQHSPVIVLIWESDLSLQLPLYCHLVEHLKWKRNENRNLLWGTSMKFSEVF